MIAARAVLWPVVALAALALAAGAGAAPKPPLSHEGRWFVDAKGRVVILRGVNMVYKADSYRPADAGFGANDARFLRRQGFDSVRLGIIYKGYRSFQDTSARFAAIPFDIWIPGPPG